VLRYHGSGDHTLRLGWQQLHCGVQGPHRHSQVGDWAEVSALFVIWHCDLVSCIGKPQSGGRRWAGSSCTAVYKGHTDTVRWAAGLQWCHLGCVAIRLLQHQYNVKYKRWCRHSEVRACGLMLEYVSSK
jgi:hypothetical protein